MIFAGQIFLTLLKVGNTFVVCHERAENGLNFFLKGVLCRTGHIGGNKEVCKSAITYVHICRYLVYETKKYASMQLRRYFNAGTEHDQSLRSMQVCNYVCT